MSQEDTGAAAGQGPPGKGRAPTSPQNAGTQGKKETDFAAAKQMQMQNKLAWEMKKIDESIREDRLSDYQKVKRQLRELKGSDKDVD